MFPKCFPSVILAVTSLLLKGADSFFVKEFTYRYRKGRCINDTGQIQSSGSGGSLSFLEFSYNSCLDPAAQFRFRDNGAMLNLKRQGCLAAFHRNGSGYDLDMFYLYVDSVSLDTAACAQKPNEGIYRAINQTSDGKLTVYYKGKDKSSFDTWCAYLGYNSQLNINNGIRYYVGLRTPCYSYRFHFGSVTCFGDKVKNANCPKDQYMVVKIASYRGLLGSKRCGLSDDYSCEVDVTCLVKKQCDGLHECGIKVDGNLLSGDRCPGLSNYLYFEYQCIDTVKPFNGICVYDMSLSYSSVPYKGVVQITTDSGTKNVCWETLKNYYYSRDIVCRQLGYSNFYSFANVSISTDAKDKTFSGSMNCNYQMKYLSQCSITVSASDRCSGLSYIECVPSSSSYKPLLEDKQRFPDSSFSASSSSEGYSASDARISSGSSWCAPALNDKHYLQVDFGRMYRIYYFVTYGDSNSPKWVVTYNLNYTIDFLDWKTRIFSRNPKAYDRAAWSGLHLNIRSLRFIPSTYVGQPCMRVEIWGRIALPDKPTNLTVTDITSRSATISWLDPKNVGIYGLSNFWIELKKDNGLILSITTPRVNKYILNNLAPYSTYEISVAAGNNQGFDDGHISSFSTSEEAPSGPPLNIRTTSRSASSLSFAWDPPETTKQNGVIIRCTVCASRSENGPCFQTFNTSERKWLVENLDASTKYYIRVFASTKVGDGNYSESKEFFTNGSTNESDGGTEKYLAGIIVLVILLVISLAIIAYCVYQTRFKPLNTEGKPETTTDENNSRHIYDTPITNNEQANNEQSTYAALKRPGPGEVDDAHVYAHLNQVLQNVYQNQGETGI